MVELPRQDTFEKAAETDRGTTDGTPVDTLKPIRHP
ncbi:hypothetical protein AF71_00011250 [Rhizobium sp. 57MFTsu3.2]|nr:hypothetical protein [Rhizobium sp. 57MFTsu3.2]